MERKITFSFPKCLLFLLFFTQMSMGQLSNFTLTVTHTNQSCTANGTLNFNATNTVPGSTILYSIYLLPNTTTPIATVSGNTYTGLVAGMYRVVAVQSLGGQTGSQQRDEEITDVRTPLAYQLIGRNTNTCVNNGSITVNVTAGNAVSYEIFAGPMIRPLQTSNTFTGLSAGIYQVRVFDNCNEGVTQTYEILALPNNLVIADPVTVPPTDCTSVTVQIPISAIPGTLIAYPLTVVLTLTPPSGPQIVYNQTITAGNPNTDSITQTINLYVNQNYTYNLVITDACGNVYTRNTVTVNSSVNPTATVTTTNCNLHNIVVQLITQATMTSAPPAFATVPPSINYTGQIVGGVLTISNVPAGTYVFNVRDVCGNPHTLTATVNPSPPTQAVSAVRAGCEDNRGSVLIASPAGSITSIFMTQAPAGYPANLPLNVIGNVISGGSTFTMNSLPVGTYVFRVTDSCGTITNVTAAVTGYALTTNTLAVTRNCNSFNLLLNYAANNMSSATFWLQKLNTVTGQWTHPLNGNVYVPGAPLSATNGIGLTNNVNNLNLSFSGHFRIIMSYKIYGNGTFDADCFRVLHEFDYESTPKIIDVRSFSCSGNLSDAVVIATGLAPLTYRITTRNGQPFIVNNGTSNVFNGLQPAIYNFEVRDNCGNIVNSLHDISQPYTFQITAADLCNGQTASLSVASFPFLTYEWFNAANPAVPMSNTAQLLFPLFNSTTNQGTYTVRITNPNNPGCINQTLSYTITPGSNTVTAGNDGNMSFCGPQTTLNLSSYLSGNITANGTWSAITTGGTLAGNVWDASGVTPGTYRFRYTVTGPCNTDDAEVTFVLRAIPQPTTASAPAVICETQALQLSATTVPNVTYLWSGPNNFTSTQQNPVISAATLAAGGTYTVQTLTAGANPCGSVVSSVNVQVVPLPRAGTNGAIAYCGSQTTIDLFTLLGGTYDANGTWSALSAGGVLTNNIWDANGVTQGVYQFRYTVAGSCNTPVSADVTITLRPIPQVPVASALPVVCDGQPLQLFASSIPNATYQWTGPNNFTSNQQNPTINAASTLNNGVYTVRSTQNGCLSGSSSVTIQLAPLPQFTIDFNCINNVAVLTATPVQGSFDPATVNYLWTNTNGFSSTGNPVTITGEDIGIYSLTVTNGGCSNTLTYDVASTMCAIPIGVSPNNDGLNDAFDLSGFTGITEVKIFNRYGMVVYEQENYVKEWQGQDKYGHMLPSATYFYLVHFANEGPRTGWVYLMREN